jgi:hypothetical protein
MSHRPLQSYRGSCHCGIYPLHRKRVTPDNLGVNVFCLEQFDPAGIPVRQTVGAAMP